MTDKKMRNREEIVFVHDMLSAVLEGEVPGSLPSDALNGMAEARDILCWVLCHDHGTLFEERMMILKAYIETQGIMEKVDDTENKNRLN